MPFKVLTAEFAHETNTFSIQPTNFAAFLGRGCFAGDDAIAQRGDANTDIAGFLDVARRHGWQTVHAVSAAAQPGGPVTRDAFDRIAGMIIARAREAGGSLDGILLGLHGAMVTDFCQDGEGELLARLRAVVGPSVPIGITLDPHANVTVEMCALADIIVSYKTYPHVDMRDSARQAAEILQRTLLGEIKPRTIRVSRPMLEEVNGGRTDAGPMIERMVKARAYERQPDVFAVSINGGFGNADIAQVGPTVLVTGQGDFAAHQAFADAIADDIWAKRFETINTFLSVEEAAAQAKRYNPRAGPIVIADYADNPGGGAYGDGTALLRALLAADVENACFGPIVDADAVAHLDRHKPGETVTLALGGKTDPRIGGGPLNVTGILKLLSHGDYVGDGPMIGGLARSWGPTAVLAVGGIEILVVTNRSQIYDQQQFKAFGIDPAKKSVVALKSMQHFRAAFASIADEIIVCDSGALCTPDLKKLPYKNVPRPIFPLD